MTPEEKFNLQVWEILQKIKEEILATRTGKPVRLNNPNIVGSGIIPRQRRQNIIEKLEEWGALSIREDPFEPLHSTESYFYLDIHPKMFESIYDKYKKSFDLQSYLNDYQEILMNGKKKEREFLEIDNSDLENYQNNEGLKVSSSKINVRTKPLTTAEDKNNWYFDPNSNTLFIANQLLKLRTDSLRSQLIGYLSKNKYNRTSEHFYTELFSEINGSDPEDVQKAKRKFYDASQGLIELIAKKTGNRDFLICTFSSVKINPHYTFKKN